MLVSVRIFFLKMIQFSLLIHINVYLLKQKSLIKKIKKRHENIVKRKL